MNLNEKSFLFSQLKVYSCIDVFYLLLPQMVKISAANSNL